MSVQPMLFFPRQYKLRNYKVVTFPHVCRKIIKFYLERQNNVLVSITLRNSQPKDTDTERGRDKRWRMGIVQFPDSPSGPATGFCPGEAHF